MARPLPLPYRRSVDIDSSRRLRRSPATWSLLGLATLVSAMPVGSALSSVLKAAGLLSVAGDNAAARELGALGFFDERGIRVAEGMAAVVSVPVAITCVLVVIGLVLWKDWAREAALGVFGLTGAFLLLLSLNGLTFDPRPRYAGLGVLVSVLVCAVAAMTLAPGVRNDFEARRLQRELREREAATAARRARIGS